jgi:hypothetical protein
MWAKFEAWRLRRREARQQALKQIESSRAASQEIWEIVVQIRDKDRAITFEVTGEMFFWGRDPIYRSAEAVAREQAETILKAGVSGPSMGRTGLTFYPPHAVQMVRIGENAQTRRAKMVGAAGIEPA